MMAARWKAIICMILAATAAAVYAASTMPTQPTSQPVESSAPAERPPFKIFSGERRLIVVNGYSTSRHWPAMLQRKLDRYCEGKRVIEVTSALAGGTPIAKWMDVNTGQPLRPWAKLTKALDSKRGRPAIVLAQQSLQMAFGGRRAGIRDKSDNERIGKGADILERYVRLAKKDGADMVMVAMHIYKKPMEPEIGNERLALDLLIKRRIPGVFAGPDVWTPTSKLYPLAFAKDKLHPNRIGAEVMAHHWFKALLALDGRQCPPWSEQEMKLAIQSGRAEQKKR